jgi:signal transduction histidine kinase
MATPAGASVECPPTKTNIWGSEWITRAMGPRYVALLSLAATLLVGVGDYLTGVETTFTLLYMFPLAFGTWVRGRTLGFVLATVATACATGTAVITIPRPIRIGPLIWNQLASLITMLLVVWILIVLRSYVDREQRERQIAIEQLRHAERLNIIGKLATGVAHELGTPLNVISGSIEMLNSGELSRAKTDGYSKTILEQTAKMSAIIRHLLDFGRRGGSSRVPIDVNDVTAHAVDLLLPTATKKGSRIFFEPSGTSAFVVANASEIEQVLSNLILNAVQAMAEGGTARLRTSVETRETADGTWRSFACIIVQDDGVGIDDRDLPRVFDPFFTTKDVGVGTGLGLSVSYGIVQDHGGLIEVKSEKGKGARFTVLLPLAKRAARREEGEAPGS